MSRKENGEPRRDRSDTRKEPTIKSINYTITKHMFRRTKRKKSSRSPFSDNPPNAE